MENQSLQVMPDIQAIKKIIGDAPATLEANIKSRDNAIKVAEDLIKAYANGMNPQLDTQMAVFVEKGNKTIKAINEKRKPFTQMMDELKKRFTGCESDIKAKVDEIQGYRNDWAAEIMKKRQEEERAARQKLEKEKEEIRINAEIKAAVGVAFYEHIADKKRAAQERFNRITLANFDEEEVIFSKPVSIYTPAKFAELKVTLPESSILTKEEIVLISAKILADETLYVHYFNEYDSTMSVFQKSMQDLLPSKKKELKDLEAADEAKKAEIEAEQKRREEAAAAQIAAEAERSSKTVADNASAEAAASTVNAAMNSLFTPVMEAPKVKEGTEIVIKNKAGYALIFQFWFEKEGKSLDNEKIEKKSIAQMKKFCEDYTIKTGETIESPFVEYKDTYKAK